LTSYQRLQILQTASFTRLRIISIARAYDQLPNQADSRVEGRLRGATDALNNLDGRFDELADLAHEFARRYRLGERPSLEEYVDRLREMADRIREIFPALVAVEQIKEDTHHDALRLRQFSLPPLGELGDYRIVRQVGRGGMGVVYEAEQISLGRRVALKVLPNHVVGDGNALERFRREAKAAARLHHTNIVPVFEVGREGDIAFYAMQFLQGNGLDQFIDELARLRGRDRKTAGNDPAGLVHRLRRAVGIESANVTAPSLRDRALGQVAERSARSRPANW
jgi:hypothetical protein